MQTATTVLKSLVSDIGAMRERPLVFPQQFGEFEDYEISDHGLVTIEWPNLAISLDEATKFLALPEIQEDTCFKLLCRSYDAWNGEEESVQEEHAELIEETRLYIEQCKIQESGS